MRTTTLKFCHRSLTVQVKLDMLKFILEPHRKTGAAEIGEGAGVKIVNPETGRLKEGVGKVHEWYSKRLNCFECLCKL